MKYKVILLLHAQAAVKRQVIVTLILFLLCELGHSQTYFSYVDSIYLVLDEVPNKNRIELTPDNGMSMLKVLLYNIPIDEPQSELDYLLTISVMPTDEGSYYPRKKITARELQKKEIKYDSLRELVIYTINSTLEDDDNAYSDRLKTYKIIPVIQEGEDYYAYTNPVLSECFGIVRQPAPFRLEELNREDWAYITREVALFFKPGILNLSAPIISRQGELRYAWWIIDESRKKHFPQRYHEFDSDSIKAVNDVNNQFINRVLLRSINTDSIYHFEYTPKLSMHSRPRTGLTSFHYHPCIGVIAASYQYHFEKYYRWVPGVKRVKDVMFTGISINGAEFEPYFRMKCLE
jgi:hypothetical protein